MVIVEASGPVEQREKTMHGKHESSDVMYRNVTLVDRRTVEISVEFPDGYVNLEGYSPDRMGMGLRETSIQSYIPDGWRLVDPDEWTVEINGGNAEWVRQANRYIDERPDMDLTDALRAFASWDETNCNAEYIIENEL